jgi:hypothetical protein
VTFDETVKAAELFQKQTVTIISNQSELTALDFCCKEYSGSN